MISLAENFTTGTYDGARANNLHSTNTLKEVLPPTPTPWCRSGPHRATSNGPIPVAAKHSTNTFEHQQSNTQATEHTHMCIAQTLIAPDPEQAAEEGPPKDEKSIPVCLPIILAFSSMTDFDCSTSRSHSLQGKGQVDSIRLHHGRAMAGKKRHTVRVKMTFPFPQSCKEASYW